MVLVVACCVLSRPSLLVVSCRGRRGDSRCFHLDVFRADEPRCFQAPPSHQSMHNSMIDMIGTSAPCFRQRCGYSERVEKQASWSNDIFDAGHCVFFVRTVRRYTTHRVKIL